MTMPKNLTQKQLIIIAAVALIVIGGLVIFYLNIRKSAGGVGTLNVTIWGTDAPKAFNDMISSYAGPGSGSSATIKYTQITAANYHEQVLAAIAAGTGPDIFEIGNRDLAQWKSVLTPIPAADATTFSLVTLQNDFPTVVGQDFVSGGEVYALPLSIDTLAMIYNRDLIDSAGIATLPATWTDFDNDVPKLRAINSTGQLTQAAAALGGSQASIANAPDIVFLMMLQNGTQMTSNNGSTVSFTGLSVAANNSGGGSNNSGSSGNSGAPAGSPGLSAFNFYLSFANSASQYYTWSDSMGTAEDSFAQGKTAIIFDYSSALADIKAKSPFLNYAVAPMLQPAGATGAINYAKYSGLAVNRNSVNAAAAWSFIISLTTSPANEKIYTTDMASPPALRSEIAADATDPVMSVFATQALSARSWPEANSATVDGAINAAIVQVLGGSANSTDALNEAQSTINGG
jgi:ABC-type glycerol-3-phosphate transport system substrate-binding protein